MAKNKELKNITRFNRETHAFSGWRVAISRGGYSFVKYFSDKQYGDREKSLEAALGKRAEIYGLLEKCITDKEEASQSKREKVGAVILSLIEEEMKKKAKNKEVDEQ